MWRVLITSTSFGVGDPEPLALLSRAGVEILRPPVARPLADAELARLLGEVDGILAGVDRIGPRALAAGFPRLRVISRYGAGVDTVDVAEATRRGVVVTNTPGANAESVADLVLGLILALARQIPEANASLHAGRWERFVGVELAGKTLGLLGFGRVGRAVARRALAFGMRVQACDPVWDEEVAARLGAARVDLDGLLRQSDFLSLHAPLTPETRHLLGEAQLRLMKPSAYLINTARGALLETGALIRALEEGWIAGAALDVFDPEPPSDPLLLRAPRLLLTPHVGAHTVEAARRMGLQAAENLLAVLQGRRPPFVVNPEALKSAFPPYRTGGLRHAE